MNGTQKKASRQLHRCSRRRQKFKSLIEFTVSVPRYDFLVIVKYSPFSKTENYAPASRKLWILFKCLRIYLKFDSRELKREISSRSHSLNWCISELHWAKSWNLTIYWKYYINRANGMVYFVVWLHSTYTNKLKIRQNPNSGKGKLNKALLRNQKYIKIGLLVWLFYHKMKWE